MRNKVFDITNDGMLSYIGDKSELTGELVIPDKVNGIKVSGISDGAFKNCTNLTRVTIPDNVTKIEDEAFFGCKSLERIAIPDSVTELGSHVCWGCKLLKSVTIPKRFSKIEISDIAIEVLDITTNCPNIKELTIGNRTYTRKELEKSLQEEFLSEELEMEM